MTTKRLFIILVFIGIFILMLGLSMGFDTWWHMKTGQLIWETKTVINTDPFSYTRYGDIWYGPATNWLSELSLFAMFEWIGFQGLMLWVAFFMTLTFLFSFLTMEGNPYWNGFVIIMGVMMMSAYRLPRPVLISTLMVAIFLWRFELFRKRKIQNLYLLPLLMILWANSHGGILLALLIWGVYFLNEIVVLIQSRLNQDNNDSLSAVGWSQIILRSPIGHLLIILALLFIALSINPEGPRMILYTFEQMDVQLAIEKINEWQSPNFHTMIMKMNLGMFVGAILLMLYNKKKIVLTDIILLLGFFSATLIYVRFLPYFILVALLVWSRYGNRLIDELLKKFKNKNKAKKELPEKLSKWINVGLLIVISIVAVVIVTDQYFINLEVDSYLEEILPVNGVDYLKENGVQGNLFNKYGDGGFIIWEMPDVKVFIDGRADLYRDELLAEYDLIYHAEEGWQEALNEWEIETVMIAPDATLAKVLRYEDWNLAFEDERAVVFYKK